MKKRKTIKRRKASPRLAKAATEVLMLMMRQDIARTERENQRLREAARRW